MLNLEKPLGIKAKSDIHAGLGTIVGVFKDFHYASLQHKIEPLVLEYLPDSANYLLVRTNSSDISRTLAFIRTSLNEILPDQMFRYRMVDEVFNSNYYVENRIFDLFKVFTALAIFVACLGLFGLTLNSVQIRVKEIGIRKVLGARISHIIYIISKSFITWVLTANVVALPLAYILMRKWLQNFAYHTSIEPDTFIVSAILAVIIAVTTVGFISFFAARQNPVNSIKQE
jgi:putative ABC transport system permease protein